MPWFQMKHGIALVIVGLLSFALERGHPIANLIPVYAGASIAAVGYMAARYSKKLPGWPSMFAQLNTMTMLGLLFLTGFKFYHDGIVVWPASVSVISDLATLVVCFNCLFATNVAFQEEFEGMKNQRHRPSGGTD